MKACDITLAYLNISTRLSFILHYKMELEKEKNYPVISGSYQIRNI